MARSSGAHCLKTDLAFFISFIIWSVNTRTDHNYPGITMETLRFPFFPINKQRPQSMHLKNGFPLEKSFIYRFSIIQFDVCQLYLFIWNDFVHFTLVMRRGYWMRNCLVKFSVFITRCLRNHLVHVWCNFFLNTNNIVGWCFVYVYQN